MGPIKDDKRGLNLSADNAVTIIQAIVEDGPEKKTNKPKQILADLAPQIISNLQIISPKSILPLLASFEDSLTEKEIQAYFTDEQTQNSISALGWGGEIKQIPLHNDYLMVVNTNLQGQKSDAKIHQTISHQSVIQDDGTVIDSVVIIREHSGIQGEKYYGVPNVDYVRIYVPEGSILTSASGFVWPSETSFRAPDSWSKPDQSLSQKEVQVGIDDKSGTRITNEFNKTAFGNWIITEPGKTSIIQFTYRLPFKIENKINNPANLIEKALQTFDKPLRNYSLLVQKQSGISSDFESQVIFSGSWSPVWEEGTSVITAKNGIKIEKSTLNKDSVWSVLMKQNKEN
jgi:hypothetical protein